MRSFHRDGLRREADSRGLPLFQGVGVEDFGERVVVLQREEAAGFFGDAVGGGSVEPGEDPVRDEAAGTQEGGVDLGGFAVDRANDMQPQEVGQEPVGDIQNGCGLAAVVVLADHERFLCILEHADEAHVGVGCVLLAPEADELRVRKHAGVCGRDEVEPVRFLEVANEVAEERGFASAGRSLEHGESGAF